MTLRRKFAEDGRLNAYGVGGRKVPTLSGSHRGLLQRAIDLLSCATSELRQIQPRLATGRAQ